jgi:hypothetical protein
MNMYVCLHTCLYDADANIIFGARIDDKITTGEVKNVHKKLNLFTYMCLCNCLYLYICILSIHVYDAYESYSVILYPIFRYTYMYIYIFN